jgi:hypothetical protein
MQTKFKDIAQYYLGTGLEMQTCINIEDKPVIELLTLDYLKDMIETPIGEKPLLRSLDSLTKPITVKGYNDGNSFVPIDYFEIGDDCNNSLEYDHGNIKLIRSLESLAKHGIVNDIDYLPFGVAKILISWHFNIFNLEGTEYIKID